MPNFSGRFFLQSRTTLHRSVSLVRVDTWRQQSISGPLSVGDVRTCSMDSTGVHTAGLQPLEWTVCPNSLTLEVSIELCKYQWKHKYCDSSAASTLQLSIFLFISPLSLRASQSLQMRPRQLASAPLHNEIEKVCLKSRQHFCVCK
jgi:hypothetical protein